MKHSDQSTLTARMKEKVLQNICRVNRDAPWHAINLCCFFARFYRNTIKTRVVISFICIQTRAVHSVRVHDSNSEISCSESSSSLVEEMLMLSLMPLY